MTYRKMAIQYHPDRVATLGDDVKATATKKFQEIYQNSQLHLIEGETHTMRKKLDEATEIITNFIKNNNIGRKP